MAGLERRVSELERAAGRSLGTLRATRGVAAGFCRCPGPVVVLFASGEPAPPFCGAEAAPVEPEPEPEVCPRCGRPRRQVVLTWNDGEGDESWR